jgi:Tfp pilus assembly protein PilF
MSLIADALKTAQREKQRRESGPRRSISPVLVPLRVVAQPGINWRNALTIGISGIVIVASIAIMVQRIKKPVARPTQLPVTSAASGLPVGEVPPGGDFSGRGNTVSSKARARSSSIDFARPPVAQPVRPPRQVPRVAGSGSPAAPKANTMAVLQGQPALDSSMSGRMSVAPRQTLSAGQLRIALEQPRQSDAGRLLADAIAAHRAGDLALARALYERVLLIVPNDADALNNLGVLFSGDREFDRALNLLGRAATAAPRNAGIWNNIGAALREQGHGTEAVAAYQHALAIDPQHQGAKIGLAQQFLLIGSAAQARVLLEEVLSANPTLPEAQYALGQALELQGDRAGAIRAFAAFMRLAPDRLAAHVERVRRHVDSLSARAP